MITAPVNRDNRRKSPDKPSARAPIFATRVAAGLWKHSGVHDPIEEDLPRLLHAAVKSYFRPARALSMAAPRARTPQVMRVRSLFRARSWYLRARII